MIAPMTGMPQTLAAALLCGALAAALPGRAQEMKPELASRMRDAAQALADSVDERRRKKLVLPFDAQARTDWHYTPRRREGLSFADMDVPQREAAHRLLRTGLSAAGHRKVVNIVELELVLKELEFAMSLLRDPEKYFVAIWWSPGPQGAERGASQTAPWGGPPGSHAWGWRFEGHHISLHFTVRGDAAIASTPSFLGANPAEVRKGPKKGTRVLAAEEDEARKLMAMFDEAQRRTAIIDSRSYGDIVTGAQDRVSPLDNRGLEVRAMTPPQRSQLRQVIAVYADSFEPALKAARLARAEEGFEGARFAWAGSTERGRPHYYRIQGPRVLIEYDASQNDGNHVHTVWRDFDGDFGRDLLRDHHAAFRH
jgi:hypothetical protein